MIKKLSIFLYLFAIISCTNTQAFSGEDLFHTAKQKIAATSSYLVDNAWRIAGTTCFATAAISAAIITKNTVIDAQTAHAIMPVLQQNAVRMLMPAGCSILGLLCFNIHKHFNKQQYSDADIDIFLAKVEAEVPG